MPQPPGEGEHVALDVEVVEDVGFAEADAVERPEHGPQGAGMLQDERESGRPRSRFPDRPGPETHREIVRIVLCKCGENADGGTGIRIGAGRGF